MSVPRAGLTRLNPAIKVTGSPAYTTDGSGICTTAKAQAGQITTQSLTTAAGSEATIYLRSHPLIKSLDVMVIWQINSYGGAGKPIIVSAQAAPQSSNFQATVTIRNIHASAALNDVIVLDYLIIPRG